MRIADGNRRIAPPGADIRVMAFGFGNLTDLLHECQGFHQSRNRKVRLIRCASSMSAHSGV